MTVRIDNQLSASGHGFRPVQGGIVVTGNRATNFTHLNPPPSAPLPPKGKLLRDLTQIFSIRNFLREYLLFNPSTKIYSSPAQNGINHEEVYIDTPDGKKLHGYFLPAKEKTNKTVIFLHGNDLNVSRWFLAPVVLQQQVPVNFLIVDYRGYGKSTGSPTSHGLITDAVAMYDFLINKGFKKDDISVYGRSLGGAVALELTKRRSLHSAVIQSSFSSLRELVKNKYPYIPSFLIKNDLFNSKETANDLHIPLLVSHGTNDKIVPLNQSEELYKNASEPKKLIVLQGAGHEHLKKYYTEEYFQALRELFM